MISKFYTILYSVKLNTSLQIHLINDRIEFIKMILIKLIDNYWVKLKYCYLEF